MILPLIVASFEVRVKFNFEFNFEFFEKLPIVGQRPRKELLKLGFKCITIDEGIIIQDSRISNKMPNKQKSYEKSVFESISGLSNAR